MTKKTKDSQIIDKFGGTGVVAKIFNIKPSSVSEWRLTGIPKARRHTMALLRPELCPKSWAPRIGNI